MRVNQSAAALSVLLLFAAPLAAQTVGELADIQAETVILRAKAAQAEAARKLGDAALPGQTLGRGVTDALPVVRGVYGTGRELYASFLYADGTTVDANTGDVLPGGYIVRALSATRVELTRKDGSRYTLGFSDVRPLAAPPVTPAPTPAAIDPAPAAPAFN